MIVAVNLSMRNLHDPNLVEQIVQLLKTTGVQPESLCEFPPVETNAARAAAITVYATDRRQGNKLPEAFLGAGVTFVPAPGK